MTEVVDDTAGAGEIKQVTFESQDAVDLMVESRLERERKKFADYDDLKAKAASFDRLKSEGLSETEKLQKELSEAQAERDSLRVSGMRTTIALELGVPAEYMDLLSGDSEDAIRAAATKVAGILPKQSGAPVLPNVANTPSKGIDSSSSDFAKQFFGKE